MVAANTNTGSLADSKQLIIDSARVVREFDGTFQRTCDMVTLSEGTGLNWEEISLAQLTAQNVTESTVMENPQQMSDSLLSLTPVLSGINTIVTDRVYARLPKMVTGKLGKLAGAAMQRKKDEDYLAVFATATTTLSGTGTTLASGIIRAAARRITSNVTEPGNGPLYTVLHGYQIKDIEDEILSGVGTYAIPAGMTEDFFKNGFRGQVAGTSVYEDGNITINATPDARGAVHSKEAVICVQGRGLRTVTKRREEIGGGAEELFMYDEYVFGERGGGVWLFGILCDATVPSS